MLSQVRLALRVRSAGLARLVTPSLGASRRYATPRNRPDDSPRGQEPPLPTPADHPYTASTSTQYQPPRGQESPMDEPAYVRQFGEGGVVVPPPRPNEIPLPPPPTPEAEGRSSKGLMLFALLAAVVGAAYIPWYKSEQLEKKDTQRLVTQAELAGVEKRVDYVTQQEGEKVVKSGPPDGRV